MRTWPRAGRGFWQDQAGFRGRAAAPGARGPGQQVDLRPPAWLQPALRSVQGDRIARRAGGADDLERRPDEQELGHAVREQRREIEVLDVPDAVPGLQLLVAWHRLALDLAD